MTSDLAQDLFEIIFDTIKGNGFDAIGTFLIQEEDSNEAKIDAYKLRDIFLNPKYEEPEDELLFNDNIQVLNYFFDLSRDSKMAKEALWQLVSASEEYFQQSASLYKKTVSSFDEIDKLEISIDQIIVTNELGNINSTINVNMILNNDSVHSLINLLATIKENWEMEDEVLLKKLELYG
jgi:hypothetical protein